MSHDGTATIRKPVASWAWVATMAPLLATIVIIGLMAIFEPRFFNRLNLLNVARNASTLSLVGVGQALVIISGGFDMSVGAVVALSSVLSAIAMAAAVPSAGPIAAIAVGVAVAIIVGIAVGLANSLTMVLLKVSPFMVTLGLSTAITGYAMLLTNGVPVYGLPDLLTEAIGRGTVAGMPVMVLLSLGAVLLLVLVQRRTIYGRYVHAIGSKQNAAELSGVSSKPHLVATYIISAVLAALVGLLLTARIGSGQANIGADLTLQSVAVAVIGGVSLRGGVGRLENVVFSAILISVLGNAMNIIKIDSKLQTVVLGIVLIAAVAIGEFSRRGGKRIG